MTKNLHLIACNRKAVLTPNDVKKYKATLDICPICKEEMWLTPVKEEAIKLLKKSGEDYIYCCWICSASALQNVVGEASDDMS